MLTTRTRRASALIRWAFDANHLARSDISKDMSLTDKGASMTLVVGDSLQGMHTVGERWYLPRVLS
jgi:hypothetical protein